jgi:hypothetical protein
MRKLAERLNSNSSYMAWVLKTYQKQERASEAKVLEVLNTTINMLYRLAICKRPDTNKPDFAYEILQVAKYTSIDPMRLANFIRQVESLEVFGVLPSAQEQEADNGKVPARVGVLTATRDRDEKTDREAPNFDGLTEEDKDHKTNRK